MLRKRNLILIFSLIGFISCVKKDVTYNILNAARRGYNTKVKTLLAKGVDVNTKDNVGNTALIMAVVAGQQKVVETLLANGADVNEKNIHDMTALAYATLKGSDGIVKLLLDNNAEVNEEYEDGNTVLILAAKGGYDHTVKLLLEKEANVDATNDKGRTALMWAARKGYANIVQTLIDHNADVEIEEDSGGTALNWAEKEGYGKIVKILKQAKVKEETRRKQYSEKILASTENKSDHNVPIPNDRTKSGNQILFEMKCSRCHVLDRPLQAKDLSSDDWAGTVMRMREKVPDWISLEEAKKIVEYLIKI